MQVIVQGRLKSRSYDDREGQKRTVFEIDVEDVGPTLRFATATVNRSSGGGGGGGGQWQGNQGGGNTGGGQQQSSQQADPWSSSGNTGGGNRGGNDPWAQTQPEEPPF